jgi:hypothetical protein
LILSQPEPCFGSKNLLKRKVIQFGSLSKEMSSEVKIVHSFGHKC